MKCSTTPIAVYAQLLCKDYECGWCGESDRSHCQDKCLCRWRANVCFKESLSFSLSSLVLGYLIRVINVCLICAWTGMITCLIQMSMMSWKFLASVKLPIVGSSWIKASHFHFPMYCMDASDSYSNLQWTCNLIHLFTLTTIQSFVAIKCKFTGSLACGLFFFYFSQQLLLNFPHCNIRTLPSLSGFKFQLHFALLQGLDLNLIPTRAMSKHGTSPLVIHSVFFFPIWKRPNDGTKWKEG
jgi:hypothetical protein